MSKRIKLKEHLNTLDEISNIMTAMKNLAFIEIYKISKFNDTQMRVMDTIKNVGSDFLNHYPDLLAQMQFDNPFIYILIGSERGFCAGFNDSVLQKLSLIEPGQSVVNPMLIVVGRKLAAKMADDQSC